MAQGGREGGEHQGNREARKRTQKIRRKEREAGEQSQTVKPSLVRKRGKGEDVPRPGRKETLFIGEKVSSYWE